MTEDQRQHLSFIQGVINRMNTNSFCMKGWMVTIVAALAALYAGGGSQCPVVYLYIAILPVTIFWCLDSYYLKMERKYRKLYEDAIAGNVPLYSMNTESYKVNFCGVMLSKTEWPIYLPVLVLIVLSIMLIA